MTPEQEKAVHAAVQNYERMREESRHLPDHSKEKKALSNAWDTYIEALNAIGFDFDLAFNLFNIALVGDPNKSTEEITNAWIQSIKPKGRLN